MYRLITSLIALAMLATTTLAATPNATPLTATESGRVITLTWNGDGIYGVRVIRSQKNVVPVYPPKKGDIVTTVIGPTNTFADKDVASGQVYTYRLCVLADRWQKGCIGYSQPITLAVTSTTYPVLKDVLPFRDIAMNLYAPDIVALEGGKLVTGTWNQEFQPTRFVNRAEFLTMLARVTQTPTSKAARCFADVRDEWFAHTICQAKYDGWIDGYADGTFRPSDLITYAEAAKLLVRVKHFSVDALKRNEEWYRPYMRAINAAGMRPATLLVGAQLISRAEMARMMHIAAGDLVP